MSAHTSMAAPVAAEATEPKKIHLDFLDGLRGLAALYVMYHHAWFTIWSGYFPEAKAGKVTRWLAFGHVSVTTFIILSGFCLVLPIARGDGILHGGALRFFKRRAWRILPPYYAAIALSSILILTVIGKTTGSQWDIVIPHSHYEWAKAIGTHLLLIQDFFDAYTINHALWSIPVECQIYFFFPLLVMLSRNWLGAIVTTAVTIAVAAEAQSLAHVHHSRLEQVNFHYLGLFSLGMLSALIAFAHSNPLTVLTRARPLRAIGTLGVVTGAGVIALFYGGIEFVNRHWLLVDHSVGVAISCLLITASRQQRNPARAFLSTRPIVWVGTISYSLYLVHVPILQLTWQYLIHPLKLTNGQTFVVLAATATPLVICGAYLFYICFERPFLSRRPNVTSPI